MKTISLILSSFAALFLAILITFFGSYVGQAAICKLKGLNSDTFWCSAGNDAPFDMLIALPLLVLPVIVAIWHAYSCAGSTIWQQWRRVGIMVLIVIIFALLKALNG